MKKYLGWIALLLVAAFIAGSFSGFRTVYIEKPVPGPVQVIRISNSNTTFASVPAPAVDPDGRGVIARISVQARPGSGKILTNIDKLLFWVDTQHSIRTAREMAENLTGLDLNSYDLIYTITANASVIEGPSAGAAMTIATIAALKNKTVNQSVMITGTIESDGSIGPAGGLVEKARAAKRAGATLFLIPKGVVSTEGAERVKNCTFEGEREICRVEYIPKKADIGKEAGINVQEVKTIKEALEYFI